MLRGEALGTPEAGGAGAAAPELATAAVVELIPPVA